MKKFEPAPGTGISMHEIMAPIRADLAWIKGMMGASLVGVLLLVIKAFS